MAISKDPTGQRGRRALFTIPVVALLIVGVAGSCTSDGPQAETTTSTSSVTAPASETPTGTGTAYRVDDLDLQFELPASFTSTDNETLIFLARSVDPPAIFSIDSASPDDATHLAETGEAVTPTTLGEVDAVLVLDADVEGLPTGIAANELVVSNGTQSFSVILSAAPADLTELWAPFIASLVVDPA